MLTNEQIALAKGGPAKSPTMPGGAMTPEQAHAWISEKPQEKSTPSPFQQMVNQFEQGAKTVASSIDSFKEPIVSKENIQSAAKGGGTGAGILEAGAEVARAPLHIAGKLGNVVGGTATALTSPMAPAFNAAAEVGKKIGAATPTPIAKAIDTVASNPEAMGVAEDVLGASMLAVPKVAPRIGAATETAMNMAKAQGAKAIEANTARQTAQQAEHFAKKVDKVAEEWKYPTVPGKSTNPASFNKATAILEKTPEIPKFLASQKLHPANFIQGGRYATSDAADALRDTVGKMSQDVLRPSLIEADRTTGKTPVVDAVKKAVENIDNDPAVTPGLKEARIRLLGKAGDALQRKYPEGLSLTNLLDNQIKFDKNGKWSPMATVGDSQISAMNRDMANGLRDLLVTKAPFDLPVGDFKKYQSQYYRAADYLDALNTKKAPESLAQYLAHRGAQVTGAVIGHRIGGGILGGVGGYMMGGALEHAIENMVGPMRSMFLQNLKVSNPEAFEVVKNYISKEEADRTTRLQLPAGPIQLPSGTKSGVEMIPAQKNPVSVDPKTGKFQTSYSSDHRQSETPFQSQYTAANPAPSNIKNNPIDGSITSKSPPVNPKEEGAIPKTRHSSERGFIALPFSSSAAKPLPKVSRVISDQLESIGNIEKNLPPEGLPALLPQFKFNLVESLKRAGQQDAAKAVNQLDPAKFKNTTGFAHQAEKVAQQNVTQVFDTPTSIAPPSGKPPSSENYSAMSAAAMHEGHVKPPTGGYFSPKAVDEGNITMESTPKGQKELQTLKTTTFYHGANVRNAADIKASGFQPSKAMPGYGMVSLSSDSRVAQNYTLGTGEVLPVKINPKNVKVYDSMAEYVKAMESSPGKTAGEQELSLNKLYDAVIINGDVGIGEKSGQLILAKPEVLSVHTGMGDEMAQLVKSARQAGTKEAFSHTVEGKAFQGQALDDFWAQAMQDFQGKVPKQLEGLRSTEVAQKLFPTFDVKAADEGTFTIRKDRLGIIQGTVDENGNLTKATVEKFEAGNEPPKTFEGTSLEREINDYLGIPNKPKPGNIEQLTEEMGGWQPGTKKSFDHALMEKDAATVEKMLPIVPEAYKQRFASDIKKILPQRVETLGAGLITTQALSQQMQDRNKIPDFNKIFKRELSKREYDKTLAKFLVKQLQLPAEHEEKFDSHFLQMSPEKRDAYARKLLNTNRLQRQNLSKTTS